MGNGLGKALSGGEPMRTKALFWEYGRNKTSFAYPQPPANHSPNVAVRDGDWKLLINANGSGAELYDLSADRNETHNLAAEHPDIVRRLQDRALPWRSSLP